MVKRRSITEFPQMIDDLRVARDFYRDGYDRLLQEHMERETGIQRDYAGERKQVELQKEAETFEGKVQALKNEFGDAVITATGKVETALKAEVSKPFVADGIKNFLLTGLTVSPAELDVLRDSFGGSYWTDRTLEKIAVQSGVDADFPASADIMFNVLHEITNNADNLTKTWKGSRESDLEARRCLSDSRLERWENTALKGMNALLSTQQKATRIISGLHAYGSPAEMLMNFHVMMRNLESTGQDELKEYVLYGVSQDEKFNNVAVLPFLEKSYRDEIEGYRDGTRKLPEPKEQKKDVLSDAEKATAKALTAKAHEMKSASGDSSDQ